nr:MAG TPA: integrase [Caudoviricetes sp.]
MNESVCIYLRKSRADREAEARGEGETLARHEHILLELAKKNEYHIGAIYKEVVSGETISARPVMQQLLREVESGMWDGVLVVEVERLARGDTIDQGVVSRAFQYSDTKIITPTKIYDPNNEFDEEYFEFGLFMSRREYKTIKRRLNAGRVSSVKEGKYCGSVPPFGYERVKLENDKGFTLKPVPEEAEIVKLIYNWYVYGIDGERLGMFKIVKKLNDMNITTQKGSTWTLSTISTILHNPVYAGKLRWNSRKTIKRIENGSVIRTRPMASEYLLSDGLHEPIISPELFSMAEKLIKENPPHPIGLTNTVKNPLSGLVYCKKCGRTMVRRPHQKDRMKDSLMCPNLACNNISSLLLPVEKAVIDGISDLIQNYKLNNTLQDSSGMDVITAKEKLLSINQEQLRKLNSQKVKQYELLEQGIYTSEVFLERSEATSKQIKECMNVISGLKEELEHDQQLLEQKNTYIPKCENLLSHYWEWDVKTRNDVLKDLIEKIEYNKDTKNTYGHGDVINFTLDIYPKLQ